VCEVRHTCENVLCHPIEIKTVDDWPRQNGQKEPEPGPRPHCIHRQRSLDEARSGESGSPPTVLLRLSAG
jgi:hypothetical protein